MELKNADLGEGVVVLLYTGEELVYVGLTQHGLQGIAAIMVKQYLYDRVEIVPFEQLQQAEEFQLQQILVWLPEYNQTLTHHGLVLSLDQVKRKLTQQYGKTDKRRIRKVVEKFTSPIYFKSVLYIRREDYDKIEQAYLQEGEE